jgi:hypothetical protein
MPYLGHRPYVSAVVALLLGTLPGENASQEAGGPFDFLAPSIVVSAQDRAALDRGQVVARVLSGKGGQVAVFVATRLDAEPDALVAWTRAIAELKRSKFVLAIGRFSDSPQPADAEQLSLDQRDLDVIRRCRPGTCGMKVSAADIESLTRAAAAAGDDWRDAVQREFRRVLVERIAQYRAGGLIALPPAADRKTPRRPEDAMSAIIKQSSYLATMPHISEWLSEYPHANSVIESFFYWSKEQYGDGKPVISITHVGIARPVSDHRLPAVVVAGKQIFATHYLEGGLGLTMIVRDDASGAPYLVYVNRSQVDLLRGFIGTFVRGALEDRLARQAPSIVGALRARLESGEPPDDGSDDRVKSQSAHRTPAR